MRGYGHEPFFVEGHEPLAAHRAALEHHHYVRAHREDMPEVRNWRWSQG